jgi:ABC-type multidrug transport system ATPase subunit
MFELNISGLERSGGHPNNFYISNITKTMGRREVLSKVSLVAVPGEVLIILGPDSAGKSSFIKALAKFAYPTQGDIYFNGLALYSSKQSEKVSFLQLSLATKRLQRKYS